jgi:hypothetical protein
MKVAVPVSFSKSISITLVGAGLIFEGLAGHFFKGVGAQSTSFVCQYNETYPL